jgi:hypothetical protein
MQELAGAARAAERLTNAENLYFDRQAAVVREVNKCPACFAPVLCSRHSEFFQSCPFVYPESDCHQEGSPPDLPQFCMKYATSGEVCVELGVHTDPWGSLESV